MREKSFYSSQSIDKWALMLFVEEGKCNYQALQKFTMDLVEVSSKINMPFAAQPVFCKYFKKSTTDIEGIFKLLTSSNPELQLVLVVLPGKTNIYGK